MRIAGGVFDSGPIARFTSWSQRIDQPGGYPFICTIHPFMSGNLDVVTATLTGSSAPVLAGEPLALAGRVPVDVEGVELAAHRHDVPLDVLADARLEHGRVADEGAAVDRLEAVPGGKGDDELAVGPAFAAVGDRQPAEHAAGDRVLHRLRVVVVGPEAGGARPGGEPVREALARLDVAAPAGEQRQPDAVR